ncbi:histone acetylation protein-domain-containing protein [Pavlovales sp. CCMP2436]|nr:histone acetylation protein-domain-containing protein [Pavlovales sp. CCMP2436]
MSDVDQIVPDGVLLVRVLSNADASHVAKRQWSSGEAYPRRFPHTLNAIMCVQEGRHTDVAIFMMYAQEYGAGCEQPNTNRVYVSYVDSVRYLKLRGDAQPGMRTAVYHALLLRYVHNCRERGFEHVHIWVEPPRLGDEYLFIGRPSEQARGLVQRFGGMLDEFGAITSTRQIPMFQGDHWDSFVPEMVGSACGGAAQPMVRPQAQAMGMERSHSRGTPRTKSPSLLEVQLRPPLPAEIPAHVHGTPMAKANSSALVAYAQRHMMRLQLAAVPSSAQRPTERRAEWAIGKA